MKWNTALYDGKHDFVSRYGEDLVGLLAPKEGEHILDLGCGTGDLAALIAQSGARVIGLDNSEEMIATARNKYPHLQFDLGSAAYFSYAEPFNAVFSNATLHWVLPYREAVCAIYRSLKPQGRFVAEFGGAGNVASLVGALKQALVKHGYPQTAKKEVWYFPNLSAYTSVLEESGFRVVFATHVDRPTPLKDQHGIQNWLRLFAQPYLQELSQEKVATILQEVEEAVRPTNFRDGQWFADYVRLRIMAVK